MRIIPVVLCFDDRILTGAGVTILSMLDSAADATSYEIHVFTPGLPNDVLGALQSLVAETRHKIIFHVIDPARFNGLPKAAGVGLRSCIIGCWLRRYCRTQTV